MEQNNVFDFKEFRKKKFEDRTKAVELYHFGDTAETVHWYIRALDAEDLAIVDESVRKNNSLLEMTDLFIKAVTEDSSVKDKSSAIKEITGLSEKVPESLVKQYAVFEQGSIEPNKPGGRADTVKFAKTYPLHFIRIVNEIYALTRLGGLAKKKP